MMQGGAVILVIFRNAVAVAQQLHDGAVARCVLFQYIACCFRYGNGADDGFGLRAEDCLTAVAFAYQRGRRVQTALEFIRFQHCCRRAFVGQKPVLTFKSPGVKETILKKIVESINDKRPIYEQQLANLETNIESAIRSKIKSGQKPNIKELQSEIGQTISQNLSHKLKDLSENTIDFHSTSDKVLDYTVIEYYSLIAMACLSGAFISMFTISSMLANMSERGKRLSVSSAKKPVLILSSFLSCYLTHLVLLFIIFLFNIYILKIDYGNNLPRILLISTLGSLAGISLGTSIGTLIKATAEVKTNIITFFFLFSCFLAGMMGPAIKYLVDTNLPFLNKINPANMIVDGLYSLNIYDDFSRYNSNIISLVCFSFICISLSITVLKKQKFKSL